jgi:hypothetical protein
MNRQMINRIRHVLLFVAACAGLAQDSPEPDASPSQQIDQPVRRLSGVGITGVSTYVVGLETAASALSPDSPWSRPIVAGGMSTNGGWHAIGATSSFLLDYQASYEWNSVESDLNGLSQHAQLSLRTGEGSRIRFAVEGIAEQRRLSSALFDPLGAISLAHSQSSRDLTQSLQESRDQGTYPESALDLWLFGRSMREAGGHVTLTFDQSRRLSWYSTVSADRVLPMSGTPPSSSGFVYQGVTSGSAAGGFQYSLSRRTSFGGTAGYGISGASLIHTYSANGGINLSHFFSDHWFAYAAAGYVRMRQDQTALSAILNTYDGSAGMGATRGAQTLVFLFHRGLSPRYGTAGLQSGAGEVTWTWSPTARPWAMTASGDYQRLNGSGQNLQGWTGRFGVDRRLGGGLTLSFDAVYAGIEGRVFGSARTFATRIAMTWVPLRLWP